MRVKKVRKQKIWFWRYSMKTTWWMKWLFNNSEVKEPWDLAWGLSGIPNSILQSLCSKGKSIWNGMSHLFSFTVHKLRLDYALVIKKWRIGNKREIGLPSMGRSVMENFQIKGLHWKRIVSWVTLEAEISVVLLDIILISIKILWRQLWLLRSHQLVVTKQLLSLVDIWCIPQLESWILSQIYPMLCILPGVSSSTLKMKTNFRSCTIAIPLTVNCLLLTLLSSDFLWKHISKQLNV